MSEQVSASKSMQGGRERGRVGECGGRRAECGLGVMWTPRASLDDHINTDND